MSLASPAAARSLLPGEKARARTGLTSPGVCTLGGVLMVRRGLFG